MSKDDYHEISKFIRIGEYQQVKALLHEEANNIEEFWLLIEAYIQLHQLERAEDLLRMCQSQLSGNIQWILWCLYSGSGFSACSRVYSWVGGWSSHWPV